MVSQVHCKLSHSIAPMCIKNNNKRSTSPSISEMAHIFLLPISMFFLIVINNIHTSTSYEKDKIVQINFTNFANSFYLLEN